MPFAKQTIINNPFIFQKDNAQNPENLQRRVGVMHFERISSQIHQLSQFATEIFKDLNNEFEKSQTRIQKINKKIQTLKTITVPTINNKINKRVDTDLEEGEEDVERVHWKRKPYQACNFFTRESESAIVNLIYDQCEPAPDMGALDRFRDDGRTCLSFYTYPQFFVEEWKRITLKEVDLKKEKRREKKNISNAQNVSPLTIKRYNSSGEKISDYETISPKLPILPPQIVIQQPPSLPSTSSQSNFIPPPPPPMPIPIPLTPPSNLNAKLGITSNLKHEEENVSRVEEGGRSGLLNDIKSQQFTLKKTQVGVERGVRKPVNEIAAILMRRAAVEMSDSDSEGSAEDDDEWS